jgi:hypothetical protein
VPRAGHDVVGVDVAFAERTAAMQAHVVEGKELTAEPEQCHMTAAHRHHLSLAGDEIVDAADDREVFALRIQKIICV